MSDQPPNETNTADEGTPAQGGWVTPSTPGAWRTPEKQAEPQGWRVPVLPEDVTQEPEEPGEWHLPSPEDTSFSPDDEIEITSSFRPEDAVMEVAELVAGQSGSAVVPADQPDPLAAPEDLMYMIEHIDEEDEADNVRMSELVALASLVDKEPEAGTLEGEDAPIQSVVLPDEAEEEHIQADQLSPSERLILGAGQGAAAGAEDDAAAYARRQLEQLAGGGVSDDTDRMSSTQPTDTPAVESDAAAYARRQLEQLAGGESAAGKSAAGPAASEPPPPPGLAVTEPVDPRAVELGRRFREVEDKVRSLRGLVIAGQMSQDDFIEQLRDTMVLDDHGVWWMMGVETDNWYRAENNNWVEATPPPLLALQQYEREQTGAPGTGYSPAVDDSLPYLDQAPTVPTGRTEEQSAGGIRLDENFMPLPDRVPIDDPDATIAGPSAFAGEIGYGDVTVPGAAYSQTTQQAKPVDYGATIRSPVAEPVDYSTAPDYELDEEGDIYAEAVDRRRRSTQQMILLAAAAFIGLMFLAGAAFVFLAISWYSGIVSDWEPQIEALRTKEISPMKTVTILDINNKEIASIAPGGDDRRPVDSLGDISPYVIHAFLTLEDRTFFENPGWSFTSTLRAFTQNIVSGEITSGGSTITQQVARNLVLGSAETTANRKVNEIVVAGELTNQFTKDEILLMYLNDVVFFGNQIYGIEAAAQFYFHKSARDLTLVEAAMLASIPSNPTNNEPVNNKLTSNELTKTTLERMVQAGCVQINQNGQEVCVDDWDPNSNRDPLDNEVNPIALSELEILQFDPRRGSGLGDYPHFTQLVMNQLSSEYGDDIYKGGYVVTTTLDSRIQDAAQSALQDRVRQLSQNGVNTGAVMVTDPRTGAILAMVGSPDFEAEAVNGQFNFALGYNQPGSTVKPILYTAALQGVDKNLNGQIDFGEYYTPATVLWDVPTTYQLETGATYSPRDIDNQYRGSIALRYALQNSYNVPAVEAFQFIGTEAFRSLAERMGVRFLDGAVFGPASALGANEMRLVDMMKVYGTLANNGQYVGLHTLANIVDSEGVTVPIPPLPQPEQVVNPETAYLMQNILSDNVARQSAFGLNSSLTMPEFSNEPRLAAKSGTTDGKRDLWTMGFTRNYVVGVWVGTFDDQQTFGNLSGSTAAGPVWNQVMRAALNGESPPLFNAPQGILQIPVCPQTGAMNPRCSQQLRNEIFTQGHLPPDENQGQGMVVQATIDSWTGLIANQNCAGNEINESFVRIDNPYAIEWINNTAPGQQYARAIGVEVPVQQPPTMACDLNTPVPLVSIFSPVDNQPVSGSAFAIQGQIAVDTNSLSRYEFQIAPAGTENFEPVPGIPTQAQPQPNPNSTLATWDTTLIPNGTYTLRLAVFSQSGGYLYRSKTVIINNAPPTATPAPLEQQPIGTPIPFDTLPPGGAATPTVDPNPLG